MTKAVIQQNKRADDGNQTLSQRYAYKVLSYRELRKFSFFYYAKKISAAAGLLAFKLHRVLLTSYCHNKITVPLYVANAIIHHTETTLTLQHVKIAKSRVEDHAILC